MKLDTKKFCKNFTKKLECLKNEKLEVDSLFHFIHELNGVAISYGFDNIGFVTLVAHEYIVQIKDHKLKLNKEINFLFNAYLDMLHEIFIEGTETHLNTKEALHLLDGFKFQLEQIAEKDAA